MYQVRSATTSLGLRGFGALAGRYRSLIYSFVSNDLKTRYIGSFMGFYWTFVSPLVDLFMYTFVFAIVLRVQFAPGYGTALNALFLFCGMIPWLTMSESIMRTVNIVRENAHLIQRVHFPPAILPTYVVLSESVGLCIRLFILMGAAWMIAVGITWHLVFLPLLVVLQLAFTLGLCLLCSCAQVFFRDVAEFAKTGLTVWMFITPIFYPARLFPDQMRPLLLLNPLGLLVGLYRDVLLEHQIPDTGELAMFSAYAIGTLILGLWVFHRHSYRFPDLV